MSLKDKILPYALLVLYFGTALVLESIFPGFPAGFFAFPLNLAVIALHLIVIWYLYKEKGECGFVKWMLSPAATVSALGLFAAACLIAGLSSDRMLTGSWWFVAVIFYFLTVLVFVTLRGTRKKRRLRPVFVFNHIGLLIALGAAFWGAADNDECRLLLKPGDAVSEGWRPDGSRVVLEEEYSLEDFSVDYYENNVPSVFEARINIGNKNVNSDNKDVLLKVNHPFNLSFAEKLYLNSYDAASGACVVRIVREPWTAAIYLGIIFMLCGAFLLFVKPPVAAGKSSSSCKPAGASGQTGQVGETSKIEEK